MRHARKELKYLWGNLARMLECFKHCVRGWREGDQEELWGPVRGWSISFRNNMWPISVIVLNTATNIPFFPASFRKLDGSFSWRRCFLEEELRVVWFVIADLRGTKRRCRGLGVNGVTCHRKCTYLCSMGTSSEGRGTLTRLLDWLMGNGLVVSF